MTAAAVATATAAAFVATGFGSEPAGEVSARPAAAAYAPGSAASRDDSTTIPSRIRNPDSDSSPERGGIAATSPGTLPAAGGSGSVTSGPITSSSGGVLPSSSAAADGSSTAPPAAAPQGSALPAPAPTPGVIGADGLPRNRMSVASPRRPATTRWFGFDGPSLDTSVWSVYKSATNLIRRPDLVKLSDDLLHVWTARNTGSGLCICRGSARPTTPYGFWEVRARAHPGADPGFAILLWPLTGTWPQAGEIDIAEFNPQRTRLLQTVHYDKTNMRYIKRTEGDFTTWHNYGVYWNSMGITFTLDGVPTATVTDRNAIPRGPMHLAIQAEPDRVASSRIYSPIDVAWVRVTR